jgi:hypothetical protein
MSNLNLTERDLSPGTLYYMRSWMVDGRQVRVARFEVVDGQVWWLPDPNVAKQIPPRSFTVLVQGRPVAVRGRAEERVSSKPGRLVMELADETPSASAESGPVSARPVRRVEVKFTTLVERLADGWEMVDGTLESA